MSTKPALQVDHLSRSFGTLVAVDDVTFDVQPGAIFGLLGPNGSGKSTIIRMLLGILPPSRGTARVLGFDSNRQAELIKPRIGYMSQQFSLYSDLSVRENLEFYARVYGLKGRRFEQRKRAVIDLTDVGDRLNQLAGTLSGGWKQRLALACSLIHEPDILFLDEPTAGIDPVARRDLWDLLFELSSRGVTLLVTTHYMDEAERCTDIGYLFMSKLLVLGKPDELKQLEQVTPPGSARFELQVEHPAAKLAVLRQAEPVHDATMFGERIHLLVERSFQAEDLRRLLELDESQFNLRPTEPTLEDVFVTLTRAAEIKAAEQVEKIARPKGHDPHQPPQNANLANENSDAREEASIIEPEELLETPPRMIEEGVVKPSAETPTTKANGLRGLWAVFVKEFFHIRRQPATLFFMLVVPVIQTILFGYAINTQIENIPTVIWDLDGRTPALELTEAFQNTRKFSLVERVYDQPALEHALRSGRAQVAVIIPPQYTENLLHGEQASIQVLIDGSDSQIATTAQSSAQLLGQNIAVRIARQKGESVQLAPARNTAGAAALPVEVRTRLLYNPDLDSSHFFVPGLVGIILQLVTLFLTSFAIVREREMGTLEQLFVTPVGRSGLLLGKLLPYAIVGIVEVLIVLTVMVYVFRVPIAGSLWLLLALSSLFMICSLALGLFVSTVAKTQLEAIQFAFVIMLPSILLSGFVFPRNEMPVVIYWISFLIPVTYFIEILRGIVLRGAEFADLIPSVVGLTVCCLVVMLAAITRFQKRLSG